ncbi:MAG: NADH-quinone oxidoreductase subunit NuoH [Thermincola sp.]|jgi:NADH-quinone oxidoreductase subunit H|nr:NADH-quinone oxidoreductase subunit NuoH [Thermincola sp.]MDT3701485.1 NADH-quinone oxidoreductase subunit NuoH [Thermincola sp.]
MQFFIDLANGIKAGLTGMGLSTTSAEVIMSAIGALGAVIFILLHVIILLLAERRVSAMFQLRKGPNRLGPLGIGQVIADVVKTLAKEDIIPAAADKFVFKIASTTLFATALLAYAVIPFGEGMIIEDLNIGIFYFIAIGSTATISILMGGWASNNKYALIGGMRAVAQMISYEVPMVFSLLGVVMLTGSLKMSDIVNAQQNMWFIVPQAIAFIVYYIAATAEINRAPFDLAEGEQELIAGYFIEYSGIRWALFMMAEYANMVAVSAIAVTLFLGGWNAPFGWTFLPGVVWFLIKIYLMLFTFLWVRWTLPRMRVDHLMHFGWKFLIPVSLANIVVTGIGIYVYRMITG